MKEKIFKIGEGDEAVTLAFNLNVMAEIQAEFKSVNAWVDLLGDDDDEPIRGGEPDMGALLKGFRIMLNEGVEIENEDNNADLQPYSLRAVGRLISKWGQDNVLKSMQDAIASSTDTGEDSKNELSTTKTTKTQA